MGLRFQGPAPLLGPTPSVSIVIATLNRAPQLSECLDSLGKLEGPPIEVIVVNGPSTDNTEKVIESFGQARLLQTARCNLSHSRNLGVAIARGEFVAMIDDDARADPFWITKLTEAFRDQRVAAVGGQVVRPNGEVEFCGGTIDLSGRATMVDSFSDRVRPTGRSVFATVMGTNCAFRTEVLKQIRLFDEAFSYYHEEADVCVRLARAGWKVAHAPKAVVVHYSAPGPRRRNRFDIDWKRVSASTVYFVRKHDGGGRSVLSLGLRVALPRHIEFLRWLVSGKISPMLFCRVVARTWAGVREGARVRIGENRALQ